MLYSSNRSTWYDMDKEEWYDLIARYLTSYQKQTNEQATMTKHDSQKFAILNHCFENELGIL